MPSPGRLSLAQNGRVTLGFDIIHRVWVEPDLTVTESLGRLPELLACDADDLFGAGWRKYLCPNSKEIVAQSVRDNAAGRTGAYPHCLHSADGARLYVTASTFHVHRESGTAVAAVMRLEMRERTRAYFSRALTCLQVLIYASQVLPVIV